MQQIYETGRGIVPPARKAGAMSRTGNMIEIYEIPYTTATEIIHGQGRRADQGRIRSARSADMRDETDLNGLKLTIDLKRGADPEKLMQKLFKHDDAAGLLRLQLQHSHRRDAARPGRA